MESNGGSGSGSGSRRHEFESGDRTESPNLRDFLRVKEDENVPVPNSLAGLTLRAVLTNDKTPSSNRTLLDVIIDDSAGGKDSKKRWKAFKDKLRLRRAGTAWTSTVHIPSSDVPIHPTINTIMSVPDSDEPTHPPASAPARELNSLPSSRGMMLRRNISRVPERQGSRLITGENSVVVEPTEQSEETHSVDEEAPVRMSLMSLLAETDRQMGLDESKFTMDEDEEEEEEEEEESSTGVEYNNCCVCMVRHKGAAFIPCGHTFCRLCSRELWVQRGNCPLCNNYILEILDIF